MSNEQPITPSATRNERVTRLESEFAALEARQGSDAPPEKPPGLFDQASDLPSA